MAIVPFDGETTKGLVGQHANSEEWNAITRLADGDPIGFGQPVYRGAEDGVCTAAANDNFLGVTRYRIDVDPAEGYDMGGHVSIMTMGVMYVAAGDDVVAGDPAQYDAVTDRWGSGDDIPGVEYETSGGDGDIIKIRINKQSNTASGDD